MWYGITFLAGIVAGIIIGLLVGRKHKGLADTVADNANKAKDMAETSYEKLNK